MSIDLQAVLKNKAINGWSLFWLISAPMSMFMVVAMMGVDLTTGPGVSSMIGFSVRWAVPFIFIVVATSSLQQLFPGPLPMWLLRNRKYIGLCFAVAMAWQGLFIFTMSMFFRDYYYEDIYFLRDELEGSVGYIFLVAMVLTSFQFARKHLTSKQWKLIHKSGLYFLWAYPFSVYWWNTAFYYGKPVMHDYVFYIMGFVAFALRIAAWGKQRVQRYRKINPDSQTPVGLRILGSGLVIVGLVAASTGFLWQKTVSEFLTAPEWSARLELWLPYWPFEPWLSLFVIGFGAMLLSMGPKQSAATQKRRSEAEV